MGTRQTVKKTADEGMAVGRGSRLAREGASPTIVQSSKGPLGRKGRATRQSIMDAALRLLETTSPVNMTAASISKEAGTAPTTFYVYFKDVEDVLWALCVTLSEDTSHLLEDDSILRVNERLYDDALNFVRGYSKIWSRYGPLLLYRNMEADRGNKRFNQLVLKIALPILSGLTDRIVESASPENPVSRSDANAEAVVMIAAMDRIAAAIHLYPEDSIASEVLLRAQARVLACIFRQR